MKNQENRLSGFRNWRRKNIKYCKYNKKDFEETNKWLAPECTLMKKELDSVVESMPGEVIFTYSRQINNK